MNKHIDQSQLSKIVADKDGLDQNVVESFIQQLFLSIESELSTNTSVKIEELGTFKIIKSGSSNRILFLGKTLKIDPVTENIDSVKSITPENLQTETESSTNNPPQEEVKSEINSDVLPPIENLESQENNTTAESKIEIAEIKTVENEDISLTEEKEFVSEPVNQESDEIDLTTSSKIAPISGVADHTPATDSQTEKDSGVLDVKTFERSQTKRTKQTKGKSSTSKTLFVIIAVLVVIIIMIVAYLVLSKPQSNQEQKTQTVANDSTKTENKRTESKENSTNKSEFIELVNNNKTEYSSIIIPKNVVSVKYLAKVYYGNEDLWPSIYTVNKNIVDKNFLIQANSIIRIPRLSGDNLQLNDGNF